jgi:hypothetical protein
MTGLEELASVLRHEGHVHRVLLVDSSVSSRNWMEISLCKDMKWGLSAVDAGQVGEALVALFSAGSLLSCTSGVRDGVQNEGSMGLAAY